MPSFPHARQAGIQDVQQELLLAMGAVVPFAATLQRGRLHIRWSPSLCRLFGVPTGKRGWRGGPLFNAQVPSEDQAQLRAALERLIHQGEPVDIRYALFAGEAQRHIQLRACLQQQAGRQRVIGVFKDCTADAAAERQVQASQERLQSVGRLTLLGEVASGLAHELNQPLAAIATFAQAGERLLGLAEPRLEKAQQVFREVSQQALRAGEIIRHMRSLIKRRAAQVESVNCDTLIRDFLALAEPMARASSVQLLTHIDAIERTVSVDVTQIQQAMMILFQNALEATREQQLSHPQVRVELLAREQGVEWAVADQGPGVSAATALQMFQPFFSTKDNGTGLGLISCSNILEAHGCRLSFDNLPERGCRFWFVLPYDAPA
ncbi:MAG: sensor histidine kinase [Steroidobacteraceae bacterium]